MLYTVSVLQVAQKKQLNQKQMKKSFSLILTICLVSISWSIQAQYDDVYYGSGFRKKSKPVKTSSYDAYVSNNPSSDDEYYPGDQEYEDYDESGNNLNEYDYAYTHRIRRFHRPLAGRSFYDPFYLDPWNYDPYYYSSDFGFITPQLGIGFYTFNDYNRWNRWNRNNRFRYWDPWAYSYWSYDPFSFNRFNNYYWASNSWCPSSWYTNRYYSNNNYWGNSYNNVYQPRYATDKSVHFGPRTYGATTTGDRGPSRSSSRVFSDPGQNRPANPGLKRSPRDEVNTTVVRERNIAIDRNNPSSQEGLQDKTSPRSTSDRESVRERTQSNPSSPKTFRDYDSGQSDHPQSTRPSPRSNEDSYRERIRSNEYSTPRSTPDEESRQSSPRTERSRETPRNESPRFESAPRQESPRFEPRQESPRYEAPRQESPRYEAPRQESPRPVSPRKDNEGASVRSRSNFPDRVDYSRSSGNSSSSFGGGSRGSSSPSYSSPSAGSSNAGGGRTSPRNQ